MTRIRIVIAWCIAISVLAVLAAVSSAADTTLKATLSGNQEKPKGDTDGSGTAMLTLKSSQVCYVITPKKAGTTFSAGHIHAGKKGVAGPVFINLFTKPKKLKGGKLSGCSPTVKAADIAKVKAKPANYYVNIHNARYPAGAVRGQLKK
jgi:CHRD domain-containing protein